MSVQSQNAPNRKPFFVFDLFCGFMPNQRTNEWPTLSRVESPSRKETLSDKMKRLWGYRGVRVGEASNPGPEDDGDSGEYDEKRSRAMGNAFKEAACSC